MTSLGEPLPQAEMDEILGEIQVKNQVIKYLKFILVEKNRTLIEKPLKYFQVDMAGNFDYSALAKQLCEGPKGLPTK